RWKLECLLASGVPADPSGHDQRMRSRVHPCARLLHHAGPDGRTGRPDDRVGDRERGRADDPLEFRRRSLGHPACCHLAGLRDREPGRRSWGAIRGPRVSADTPWTIERSALWIVAIAVVIFFAAPLVIIIVASFGSGSFLRFPPAALTTDYYVRLANAPQWL